MSFKLHEILDSVEREHYVRVNEAIRELYAAASWGEAKVGASVDPAKWILAWLPSYIETLESPIKIEKDNEGFPYFAVDNE